MNTAYRKNDLRCIVVHQLNPFCRKARFPGLFKNKKQPDLSLFCLSTGAKVRNKYKFSRKN